MLLYLLCGLILLYLMRKSRQLVEVDFKTLQKKTHPYFATRMGKIAMKKKLLVA
jgi:hypothetical protein